MAKALDLDTEELLVEWLCDKVQKVLKEESEPAIIQRSLQQLNGVPLVKKAARSSAATKSQEAALARWKERCALFRKQENRSFGRCAASG